MEGYSYIMSTGLALSLEFTQALAYSRQPPENGEQPAFTNRAQPYVYWGGPSWWAWFWQLARLPNTELLLLVIMRHLHLRPSCSSVSLCWARRLVVNRLQAFLSKLGWFSQTR